MVKPIPTLAVVGVEENTIAHSRGDRSCRLVFDCKTRLPFLARIPFGLGSAVVGGLAQILSRSADQDGAPKLMAASTAVLSIDGLCGPMPNEA